jgi:tetratricopeptide (TPR) repeat protein
MAQAIFHCIRLLNVGCPSERLMHRFLVAVMASLGALTNVSIAEARAPNLRNADLQIDTLVAQSRVAEDQGKAAVAATIMKQAAALAETLAPKRLYPLLERLDGILAGYDNAGQLAATNKMVDVATRRFGQNDFRTLSARLQQALNAGELQGQTERMMKAAPDLLAQMGNVGKSHDEIAKTAFLSLVFANDYVDQGRSADAKNLTKHALALLQNQPNFENADVARAYSLACALYNYWYDSAQSVTLGLRAVALHDKLGLKNSISLSFALNDTAQALTRMGRTGEAEPLFIRGLKIVENRTPTDAQSLSRILDGLAQFYDETGHRDLAEPLFVRAVSVAETLPATSTDLEGYLGHLAQFYFEIRDFAKAREVNQRETFKALARPNSPYIPRAYLRSALIALAEGRLDEAAMDAEKGRLLRLKAAGPNATDNSFPLTIMARIASKKGDLAAAADYWSKAIPFVAMRGYPNREHEETAITASWAYVAATRDPAWQQARDAGNSLQGRITQNALLASGQTRSDFYEPALFDKLLDIAWATRK